MDINSIVNDLIKAFGEKLIVDIRESLKREGVTYGGGQESKLAAQIKFTIIPSSKGIKFQLIMPDYYYYLNTGRKPGGVSEKGQESLGSWGARKGYVKPFANKDLQRRKALQMKSKRKHLKPLKPLPFSKAQAAFAFVVARTIKQNGYEGNHFLDNIIKDGRVEALHKEIEELINKNL